MSHTIPRSRSWLDRLKSSFARKREMLLSVTVVVVRDDHGYHAYCPAFKGLHMDGDTEQETLKRTRDGLRLYLRSLARHGDPLPVGPDCMIEGECSSSPEHLAPANSILKKVDISWPSTTLSGIS